MKIVTTAQMQRIEQECNKIGLPTEALMDNAGKAVAEEIKRILGILEGQCIFFLIGPGNNGGDGLVAARHLNDWGTRIEIYLCSERRNDSNLELVKKRNITCIEADDDNNLENFDNLLSSTDCIIDALFGTGKIRPLQGFIQKVLDRVSNAQERNGNLRVIAIDVPSGLNADTGAVDPVSLFADNTITLGFPKYGLFRFPGIERTGEITTADIGIPGKLAKGITDELITGEWAADVLPQRPLNANKGTFGKVLVAAGSTNYTGAAYLACSGAMRVGTGLVTLAIAAGLQPILAAKLTEVTYMPLPESQPGVVSLRATEFVSQQFDQYNTLLLGNGLGQSQPAMKFVSSIFLKPGLPTLVLDADALNTLAQIPNWWREFTGDAILTPHPGEMSRMCDSSVDKIQSDRIHIAKKYAIDWHKTIVLKGANTVIAAPDGRCRISPFANPGMASAGTGDVLAGAIAGMVAQGLPLFDAASLGVYVHGKAGEVVRTRLGDAGMIATDLLPELPLVIKRLKDKRSIV